MNISVCHQKDWVPIWVHKNWISIITIFMQIYIVDELDKNQNFARIIKDGPYATV